MNITTTTLNTIGFNCREYRVFRIWRSVSFCLSSILHTLYTILLIQAKKTGILFELERLNNNETEYTSDLV